MSIIGSDAGAGSTVVAQKRRRTARRLGIWGAALLFFAAIAGGGWYLVRSPDGTLPRCAAGAPSPAAPAVRVLNGTGRAGLASDTASALSARGFRIAGIGNAAALPGTSQVRYGRGATGAAGTIARQLPSSVLVADPRVRGRIDLVLGRRFTRLRTPAEVAAAGKAAAKPSRSARPSPSPTCR